MQQLVSDLTTDSNSVDSNLRDVLVEVLGQVRDAIVVAPVKVLRHVGRLDVRLRVGEINESA